jgi:2-polyprenyl-6-methoxyphenol hydroxylase-like FAD-dependent oxidoreductase
MNIELSTHRNKALVIGGSMAGLLAARVLADFYQEVIVLERDDLENEEQHRRGVPHARHAHALLAGGQKELEKFFPGISGEMIEAGATQADAQNDGTWFFEGAPLCKGPSGKAGVLVSRPLLESTVRNRVRSIKGVRVLPGQTVRMLASSDDKRRITGVVTEDGMIEADIVVDASGRGSRSGVWLEALGFQPAKEEKVEVQLAYTTRLFKPRHDCLPDDKFVVVAPTPHGKRGGVMALQEGDRWIVTLFGHFGHIAPRDLEGFIDYARSLPCSLIYHAIRDAKPIGEPVNFRFPASTRRHYEQLARFPEGYLVFGDAICSFNPIYGQGMSVAALQAEALHETLQNGTNTVTSRFFKNAAKVIDNPWNMSVGADLNMPENIARRGTAERFINWYISNVHKLGHSDPTAALAFIRVAQLLDPPTKLMGPRLVARVLFGSLRRRFEAIEKTEVPLLTTAEPIRRLPSDGF